MTIVKEIIHDKGEFDPEEWVRRMQEGKWPGSEADRKEPDTSWKERFD